MLTRGVPGGGWAPACAAGPLLRKPLIMLLGLLSRVEALRFDTEVDVCAAVAWGGAAGGKAVTAGVVLEEEQRAVVQELLFCTAKA